MFNLRATVHRNDKSFEIPINAGVGIDHVLSTEERWLDLLIAKLISVEEGGSFLDVGVNIGQTLLKLKSIHPNMHYIGFEPNPVCVQYAEDLITLNSLTAVEIFPVALSKTSGVKNLRLFSSSKSDSTATIIPGFRGQDRVLKEVKVPAYNFSDLGSDITSALSFLKIDVEGGELDVLEGLILRIKKDRPIIVVEILPTYGSMDSMRTKRQELLVSMIQQSDYQIFRILKDGGYFKDLLAIDSIENDEDLDGCDYLMLPTSKAACVMEKLTSETKH